jgi:hypothetical protein
MTGKVTAMEATSGSSPRGSAGFAQEFLRWRCLAIERERSRPNSSSAISDRDGRVRLGTGVGPDADGTEHHGCFTRASPRAA